MRPDETDQQPAADAMIAELRRMRTEHPDAQISTELIRFDQTVAVIRASIALPNAGSATGFGASASGGPAAIETAETRALSRALAVLGYGATAEAQPAPRAVPSPAPAAAELGAPPAPGPAEPAVTPVSREAPAARASAAAIPDEPQLADYSWTEFWKWARAHDYQNRAAVEELIGQPIASLNPAQVRNLIRAKTGIE